MLSVTYLRYWHTRFNRLVFDGKLAKAELHLRRHADWGRCWGNYITINRDLSPRDARATLLHEMIHQWQFNNGLRMDHGRSFKQWEDACVMLTGLQP